MEGRDDCAFILWRVFGFGGKANLLVYGRVGSARAGLRLYVDDLSIVVGGTLDECAHEFDVILLFWLALGFTLVWAPWRCATECKRTRVYTNGLALGTRSEASWQ